ncbi:MAG: beta-lactamase family protein [Acidobacteriota bacterium]|nr:beta-lactamase family protein [Acidobacteriota bacterium]MDH3530057.1 beta-lactamase family protein [Acidobacteriota bacterium]
MKSKKAISIFVLFACFAGTIFPNATAKEAIQKKLDNWHANAKFPGATLGVTLSDGTSYGVATGYSDRVKKKKMSPDDMMLAGSVGKTWVAAVAMQQAAKGELDLDAKISKYLGKEAWFKRLPNANNITVRQLMNHTSGLVRYEFNPQFIEDLKKDPYKVWKPEEQIAYLFDTKAEFEAGRGWDYSDTNYIVLGMIIERIAGKSYYELAETRLLKPLKLSRTIPQTGPVLPGLIPGYAGAENPFGGEDEILKDGKFVFNPQFEWTGGGMVSNSIDLSRWAKMMYEGRAFDRKMLPQFLDGVPAKLGPGSKYGLGVIIRETKVGTTYGHSGFFPGYVTDMMYLPEHKIAVAIQVNSSVFKDIGRNPAGILIEALEVLAAENKEPGTAKLAKHKKNRN